MLPVLPFVLQLVSPIITSVILDRLAKFKTDINWTQVKLDVDKKIRAVVPGDMLDDMVVMFVNRQINNVYEALRDTQEQQKVLGMLIKGDWAAAGKEVIKHAFPNVPST